MVIDRFLSEPKDFKDVKDEAGSRARKSKREFFGEGIASSGDHAFQACCFQSSPGLSFKE